MDLENNLEEQKYIRAKKKVETLKGYYMHLTAYVIINSIITIDKIVDNINDEDTFLEALFRIDTLIVWFLWGVPMLLHTFKVIGFNFFLGNDWEERKIKEYLNESNEARR